MSVSSYIEIGDGNTCSVTNNLSHGAFADNEGNSKRAMSVKCELPAAVSSVEILETTHNNCTPDGNIVICSSTNMVPGDVHTANIKVILTGSEADEDQTYRLSLDSISAEEDVFDNGFNDEHVAKMNTKSAGSLGMFLFAALFALGITRSRQGVRLV